MLNKILKSIPEHIWIFEYICALMCVVGFFLPPTAVIDGSVLVMVGLIEGSVILLYTLKHISEWLKISRGDDDDIDDETEE